eukprot:845455-Prorocentrum_minimum.AAC.3
MQRADVMLWLRVANGAFYRCGFVPQIRMRGEVRLLLGIAHYHDYIVVPKQLGGLVHLPGIDRRTPALHGHHVADVVMNTAGAVGSVCIVGG